MGTTPKDELDFEERQEQLVEEAKRKMESMAPEHLGPSAGGGSIDVMASLPDPDGA